MARIGAFIFTVAVAWGAHAEGLAVLDGTGTTVRLSAPAQRIVSLAPHATELLFAAGAGSQVIGVIDPADWPRDAARLPRVGDARSLDLERIVALRPDLAVAWPFTVPTQVERLRSLGVALYVTDAHTPEAIADDIERLGALAGREVPAERAAGAFRRRLAALRARTHDASPVRVFYEIWNQPLYTIGGGHLITAALSICGGDNVFASSLLPAPSVSVEAVLAAAPDAIIAATDDAVRPAWLDDWRRWTSLPAVRRDNLMVVDANLLHRPGPRFVEGVEQLCAALDRARVKGRMLADAGESRAADVAPPRDAPNSTAPLRPKSVEADLSVRRAIAFRPQ
jgi:iron complex transport system substrate-binding protein